MNLLDTLFSQGVRAWREPRAAAADVIALGVPREALVPALLLVVVVSVIINAAAEAIAPSPMSVISHFQMTVFLLALFVTFAFAVCKVGQAMDGVGKCEDSLLLAIFFQAIFIPAQVLQVALMVAMPAIAGLFALFLFVFGMWVNVNFVSALHGFPTLGKGFGVLLIASFIVAVVMLLIAPLVGVSLLGELPNV